MIQRPKGAITHVRGVILVISLFYGVAGAIQTNPLTVKNSSGLEPRRANIILPNVDDDNGDGVPDCLAVISNGTVDADILPVRIKPRFALPQGAVVRVEIADPWTRFARVFIRDTSQGVFQPLQGPVGISSDETAGSEITIGVEALDFADAGRPPLLNLNVFFETKEGRPLQKDDYEFTVAPILVSCCLDPANDIHVVKTNLTQSFVNDLGPAVRAAGAELRIFEDLALPASDIWIQDAAEIGWATDGERLMHVVLHGNRGRRLDDLFAKKFLGRDSGVVQKGDYQGKSAQWIDWFGNLEVSPPVKVKGREYRNGRIYAGTQGERSMHPAVIRFLEAQGGQSPVLWIDTSWLVIGHG
jgi:protein-arginine deiminase